MSEDINATPIPPESGSSTTLPSSPQPVLKPVPPPSLGEKIFFGADGLRAGWRLALYLIMARGFYLLLGVLLYYFRPRWMNGIWLDMASVVVFLLVAGLPALVMAKVEGRSFGAYGLPRCGAFGKLFWVGVLWGIAAITVLMLVMYGTGVFHFGRLALHGIRIWKFAAFWGLFFLFVGFSEEFLMRGFTQFTLTQGVGFWPAALLLSITFGAIHLRNPGEAWIGLLSAGLIGLFFCLTLRRTGNLWFAVGFHASWDWGQTYLYSVPDSGGMFPGHLLSSSFQGKPWLTGGTVGPEGSVLVFVLIAVMWIAFDRLYRETKYPG